MGRLESLLQVLPRFLPILVGLVAHQWKDSCMGIKQINKRNNITRCMPCLPQFLLVCFACFKCHDCFPQVLLWFGCNLSSKAQWQIKVLLPCCLNKNLHDLRYTVCNYKLIKTHRPQNRDWCWVQVLELGTIIRDIFLAVAQHNFGRGMEFQTINKCPHRMPIIKW